MGFEIKVDGETVHTVDIDPRLVTGARMHSAAGEAGVAAAPFSGVGNDWINITLDVQQPTALPVVEDDARLEAGEPNEVLVHNPVAVQAEEDFGKAQEGTKAAEDQKAAEEADKAQQAEKSEKPTAKASSK